MPCVRARRTPGTIATNHAASLSILAIVSGSARTLTLRLGMPRVYHAKLGVARRGHGGDLGA